ncbi:MAG: LPS export ABC transporter permease LptG [Gammaproteobacteria bacterium TMED78]|nr:MAG: LPS export ABC transporter permease LptG [Gammaproteobacteria bacterium TMED78]|tara:strand:+ start:50376 stop:51443 length:1068 start_codon:yes stop_codon:yes gene_type:complete
MSIIDKYIISNILKGVFAVTLVLISISSLMDFLYQLNQIGNGSYFILDAITYICLGIPRLIVQTLPVAALIGALLSLGSLSQNHELIVIRSSGVSTMRLVKSVSLAGLILFLIMMILSQSIAPSFGSYAQQYRTQKLNNTIEIPNLSTIWLKDGNNIINLKKSDNNSNFNGIYIFETDGYKNINKLSKSETGRIDENNNWILTNHEETIFQENKTTSNSEIQIIKKYSLSPEILGLSEVQHDFLNNQNLSRYIQYLEENELDSKRYHIAFWSRIADSTSVLLMTILALPFVVGSLRSASIGRKLITGLLIGLAYYISAEAFINSGEVYNINAFIVAWTPTSLLLILNFFLLLRIK